MSLQIVILCPSTFVCPWCEKSKTLCKAKNVRFTAITTPPLKQVNVGGTMLYPPKQTYPQIYIYNSKDGRFKYVGGYEALLRLLQ